MSLGGIKIEWNGTKVLKALNSAVVEVASKEIAEKIAAATRQRISSLGSKAGDLGNQVSVKESQFKDGKYLVGVQMSGKWTPPYRASFVELGHHSSEWGRHKRGSKTGRYIPATPFLRPAAHSYKRKARVIFEKALDDVLKAQGGTERW